MKPVTNGSFGRAVNRDASHKVTGPREPQLRRFVALIAALWIALVVVVAGILSLSWLAYTLITGIGCF